jgi:hypothetical protein
MQPTIHWEGKAGYSQRPYPALHFKCIVGCIFNSVGLIITRESPCISVCLCHFFVILLGAINAIKFVFVFHIILVNLKK